MNHKKKIFLIVGRTSSGKTTVSREVCQRIGLQMVKSYTTRPPRPKEINSECDHYFISEDEIEKYKINPVAETNINGFQYFATMENLVQSDLYVIDPIGRSNLLSNMGDQFEFITIYVRRPREQANRSAKNRGDLNYQKRIEAEDKQFTPFEKEAPWEYHVLNNTTFEEAVNKMERIIRKELEKGE